MACFFSEFGKLHKSMYLLSQTQCSVNCTNGNWSTETHKNFPIKYGLYVGTISCVFLQISITLSITEACFILKKGMNCISILCKGL